jgi:hypothetical protein
MKNLIVIISLASLLAGCAWIKPENRGGSLGNATMPANDTGPGRGTTGVSSGADFGAGVTGSDAARR